MVVVSDTNSCSSPARWTSPFDLRGSAQPSPLAPGAAFGGGGPSLESTVVTASAPVSGAGGMSSFHPGEAAESRVARPARRRTRTSRKAPVTLLNTDTTNFRAMVQQFTGFPAPPPPPQPLPLQPQYSSSYGLRPGFNLSIFNEPSPSPPLAHFLQRPQYQLEQQQQQQQQMMQMQYQFPETAAGAMFRVDRSGDNNRNNNGGFGQNEAFLHNSVGGSGGNLELMGAAGHDVFLFGGQMTPSSTTTTMMRPNSGDRASRIHDEYYSS